MSNTYNPLEQFSITSIMLYRDGWLETEKIDIKPQMYELHIYEDIFNPTLSASLVISDIMNMPDVLPIVGGENIDIIFKTPAYAESQKIRFKIALVTARMRNEDSSAYQGYTIELVTPDRYNDANSESCAHFEGPYSTIVKSLLNLLGSTKKAEIDPTLYNQRYVLPFWTPLKACKHIASRSMGSKYEPFFFYETIDGYKFKSVLNLYKQEAYAKLRIEPGRTQMLSEDGDSDNIWRRAIKFEIKESYNVMRHYSDGGFGGSTYVVDMTTKRTSFAVNDYKTMSQSANYAKIDNYPLADPVKKRNRVDVMLVREDRSHEGAAYRNMVMSLMDNYRIKVAVLGDSRMRAGYIIDLDIPNPSISNRDNESTTSGRWLIVSLRHMIKRETYVTVLELCKDSHKVDVASKVDAKPKFINPSTSTGIISPEEIGNPLDTAIPYPILSNIDDLIVDATGNEIISIA